jgi:mutator protein MutT
VELNGPREYPDRPIVGVGGVIVDNGKVLLVRRRHEPLKGHWSLPGGMVEIGETLEAALTRELLEETGLAVDVGPVIEVFDRITPDEDHRIRYHFVLIDYLCWPGGGALRAGSDVDAAIWADPDNLAEYSLTDKATSVIRRGMRLALEAPRPVR